MSSMENRSEIEAGRPAWSRVFRRSRREERADTSRLVARDIVARYGALGFLVAMVLAASIMEPGTFPTSTNLINILSESALTAIIAMGLTFVLVTGDFDVSIGYVASISGIIVASLLNAGFGLPLAFILTLACGLTVGLVNGFLVTVVGVNAFVTTLGVGTAVVGVNYAISGGISVAINHSASFLSISLTNWLGVPVPVYIMFGAAVLFWLVLNRTELGLGMQAVGGNRVAARLAGVRVGAVRVAAFAIAGVSSAACGILLATQTGSPGVTDGDGYLLNAFAAAFFGSAVLRDGRFHIVGTVVGVITVATGFDAINLIGMPTYWQFLVQGILLVLGVAISTLARRSRT